MNSIILRFTAHYGQTKLVAGVPCVGTIVREVPLSEKEVINIPWGLSPKDVGLSVRIKDEVSIDDVISAFEEDNGSSFTCKVASNNDEHVYEFSIIEPTWDCITDARLKVDSLCYRILSYVEGNLEDCFRW